ncbi:MAG: UvrB/UvrC motif-containing protein [candidate division WOR-3 bacterium]|nr:UvrB/UvrC motif-containing protein [candidate division WOR-3 bacterium]
MKLCDICGKKEATLVVRQLDKEGKATDLNVCAECAKKRGLTGVEECEPDSGAVIAELKSRMEESDSKVICPRCGMSFAEFKRAGRLGCADCYQAFTEKLKPIIRRLHGAVQHIGKTANQGRKRAQERLEIQRLRAELEKAIKQEDYEKAAALRDRLKRKEDETDS